MKIPTPGRIVMVRYRRYGPTFQLIDRPAIMTRIEPEGYFLSVLTGDPDDPVEIVCIPEIDSDAAAEGWFWPEIR